MTIDDIRAVPAIDFHSHFGQYAPGEYYAETFEDSSLESLRQNMAYANIAVSINSYMYGLLPRGCGDAVKGNEMIMREAENVPGVYIWAIVNPLQKESYAQAADMLKHPKVLGIKIHPEEHLYPIRKYGEEIYSFAAENRALIITHSGEENSLPEDFCLFANRYPDVQTICSHMGCGYDGNLEHQMRAIEMNTNDNLYTDTSSAKSLTQSLIEYAVKRIGSEKILFGTDNSCYFSPCQRARIDYAHIPAKDKYNILCGNALRLFPFINLIYERETAKIKN